MTVVKLCPHCKPHQFQDKEYGKNMRVMNKKKSDPQKPVYRCTVCSRETDKD